MASLPEPQFEEEMDKFDAGQLKAVEALYAHNPDVVDLEVAKNLCIISDDTKKKIEQNLGKEQHMLFFQRALAKENRNVTAEEGWKEAFKRAFMNVYGKFLFEEKNDDFEKQDSPLVVQLNKVLRFHIDDKTGFKGRSELQAAIRRLRLLSGSRDEVDVTLSGLRQQKTDTESKIVALRKTNAPIVYKLRKLDELHGVEEFDSSLGRLERIEEMGKISKGGSNTLKSEKKPELRKQLDQRQSIFVECFEKIHSACAVLREINQTLTEYYPDAFNYDKLGISKLLADLDEFLNADDENFDIDRLEELFHKHLKPLSKKLSSRIFFRTLTSKVHGNPVLAEKIKNFLSDVQYLDGAIHKIREYGILLHDLEAADQDINDFEVYQIDNAKSVNEQKKIFFQQLNAAASAVQEFAKKNVPKDAGDECGRYLEASEKFGTEKDLQPRTLSELRAFVQNVYKPFLDRLRGLLQNAKDANDGQLSDGNNALLDLNTRIARFENYQASNTGDKDSPLRIIDRALGGSRPGTEIKTLERQLREAQKGQSDLQGTSEYFSGPDLLSITETYTQFTSLLSKSTFEEPSESFQAKKFRLEAEYNALNSSRVNQGGKKGLDQRVESKFRTMKDEKIEELARERLLESTKDNVDGTAEDERRIKAAARASVESDFKDRAEEIKEEIRDKILDDDNRQSIKLAITQGKEAGKKKREFQLFQDVEAQAKALSEKLKMLLAKMENASKAGVEFKTSDGKTIDVKDFKGKFENLSIASDDFSPTKFSSDFTELISLFKESSNVDALLANFDAKLADKDKAVKDIKAELDKAKSANALNENLTDAQAAKKIIAAMVAEQNPDMSLADQQKLASMILANDVATLQTEASYEELAKRGSAEVLDTVQQAGFKRKLIGFQYKEGDKAVQPFKGLKPEQFNDWAEIERLFKIGRLNHQNGFFVLAAMKEFAPMADGRPIPQIQAVKLEKKLKAALAEELGVDERMDEAGIDKILNKAFADQMKKAEQLVKAYFQHFDRNVDEWNGNKIKELNLSYARVREELRLGKINDATFGKRMAELVEEAKETEVLDQVKFSQDSAMAGYWNSPFSQWFRDRGWDIGQYAKGKAKSLALSGVKLGAFGLWGATKLGLSATLQTALLPLRAVKYPLLLAAKPLIGVINLFRSQKWTPLPTIRDAVRSDAGRVVGYFKTKVGETWKGTVEKGTGVPKAEWEKTPYAGKKYSERTKVDMGSLKEQAGELKAKGDATPVEVAGSPFIDLKKYRDEIAKLDRILAQKPAEERGDSAGEKRAAG